MHFRNLHGLFGDTLGWLLNRRKIWTKTCSLQSFLMFLWPNLGEVTIYWIVACTTTSWEVVLWAHHVLWNLATHWSWTGQVVSRNAVHVMSRCWKVHGEKIMKLMKHSCWCINSHVTFDIQGTLHELDMKLVKFHAHSLVNIHEDNGEIDRRKDHGKFTIIFFSSMICQPLLPLSKKYVHIVVVVVVDCSEIRL